MATSSARQRRWVHPSEALVDRARAYYSVLNEDPDGSGFPAALRELYDQVHLILPRRAPGTIMPFPPPALAPTVAAFCERWRLPRRRRFGSGRLPRFVGQDGVTDLWQSLTWTLEPFNGLRILTYSITSPFAGGVIEPIQPRPFRYDPTTVPPEWLAERAAEIAKEVERSIIDQAAQIEAEPPKYGYRQPAQRNSNAELRRMALRLYRRAIMCWTWDRIAEAEQQAINPGDDDDMDLKEVDPSAVRHTVEDWARQLNIQLPVTRRGRPSKK